MSCIPLVLFVSSSHRSLPPSLPSSLSPFPPSIPPSLFLPFLPPSASNLHYTGTSPTAATGYSRMPPTWSTSTCGNSWRTERTNGCHPVLNECTYVNAFYFLCTINFLEKPPDLPLITLLDPHDLCFAGHLHLTAHIIYYSRMSRSQFSVHESRTHADEKQWRGRGKEAGSGIKIMAGLVASFSFALLSFVFIAVGSFLTLLRAAWEILRHPFQALKKTPRDGE